MSNQGKLLLSAAGISLLAATIAGAVGSHALTFADAQALRSFETAVQFQFFHGLGVIAIVSGLHTGARTPFSANAWAGALVAGARAAVMRRIAASAPFVRCLVIFASRYNAPMSRRGGAPSPSGRS